MAAETTVSAEQLFEAIRAGDAARAQELIGAQPRLLTARSAEGLSPLISALYFNRLELARWLMERLPADSLTIHDAAAIGDTTRLEHVLAADSSAVNAWSPDGFQPLGLAAFFGHAEAVDLLLARGAEVNTRARHRFGVAAINAALAGPTPEIARALVAAGADVNAAQNSGETPLHATAFNGALELTRFLLEHGANPAAKNDQGQTPADIARARGHTDVAELLT
jgi:uncharacterized protein